MEIGAIIRTASIAERHPAAPVDIALRTMAAIATQQVHGASILTPSIGAQRPALDVVRRIMTMPITAIPTVRG